MKLISHPQDNRHEERLLVNHLEGVAKSASRLIRGLSLNLNLITKEELIKLAYMIGLMHDVAKASSYFQDYIRGGSKSRLSRHSLASAIFAYQNTKRLCACKYSCFLAFKAIQKHHGDLSAFFSEALDKPQLINETLQISKNMVAQIYRDNELRNCFENNGILLKELDVSTLEDIVNDIDDFEPRMKDIDDHLELFLIQNLLFSVLTMADKHDAARLIIEDNSALIQNMNYSPEVVINSKNSTQKLDDIRHIMRQHIINNESITPQNHQYAMSAPTGSGKTFSSLEFAEKLNRALPSRRRIVYCLPYTSIIDQNYEEVFKVLQSNHAEMTSETYRYLIKHHHLSDFYQLRSDQEADYSFMDYLNDTMIADSWGSASIVSTFVQFFHSIVGNRNGMLRKMHNIINSIVILDEVQCLPPEYYLLMRAIFRVLAQRFDTYIMTCTATQPYIFEPHTYIELTDGLNLDRQETFNRVKLYIHPKKNTLENMLNSMEDFENWPNALFVMNTKASAIKLYRLLQTRFPDNENIFCLTTRHIPKDRKDTIEKVAKHLKNGNPVFLVSTQLIEAGVDLSFAKVVRDMGPLDSIIQVAGRCNRHGELGELGGEMHLFNLIDERGEHCKKVYHNYLLAKTREILGDAEAYESNDFSSLSQKYYSQMDLAAKSKAILDAIKILNYDQDSIKNQIPVDRFKLIEESYANQTVYIPSDEQSMHAIQIIVDAASGMEQGRLQEQQLKLKKAYQTLSYYSLSLSASEIANYAQKASYFHKLKDNMYYIEADQRDNAYCCKIGFLIDPEDSGACLSC